jgi:hypothetical protein
LIQNFDQGYISRQPWTIIKSAYDYQTQSCLNLSKNKPQINADERRLIKSKEETCFLNSSSIPSNHIYPYCSMPELSKNHRFKALPAYQFQQTKNRYKKDSERIWK